MFLHDLQKGLNVSSQQDSKEREKCGGGVKALQFLMALLVLPGEFQAQLSLYLSVQWFEPSADGSTGEPGGIY